MASISNDLLVRRIGLVAGKTDPDQVISSLGQTLILLDSARTRFALPIETTPIQDGAHRRLHPTELSALILDSGGLGGGIKASEWVQKAASDFGPGGGAVVLAAPFLRAGATSSSFLVWPFEESVKTTVGSGSDRETWVQTDCLSREAAAEAARSAGDLARERKARLIWVDGGWGGREAFSLLAAREALEGKNELEVVPVERLQSLVLRGGEGEETGPVVLLSSSRTAVVLGRLLGAEAWVAWVRQGVSLLQSWGKVGHALGLALLFDRMGFVNEGAELDRLAAELKRANVENFADTLIERLIT